MSDTSTILNMTEESLASMQTAGGFVMASKTGATHKVPLTDFAKVSDIPAAITVDSALSTTSENPVQNKVVTAAVNRKAASGAVAPEYSPSSTYPTVGTACMHGGVRYVSNTAITAAEEWTPAHWTEKSVEDEIGNVEALLAAL